MSMLTGLPLDSALSNSVAQTSCSLIVIDATAKEKEVVAITTPEVADVLILDKQQDGVMQISEALLHHRMVTQLHIFADSTSDSLYLGNTELNLRTVSTYALLLMSWFLPNSLAPDACLISLHHCHLGTGVQGQRLLEQLEKWTGSAIVVHPPLIQFAAAS